MVPANCQAISGHFRTSWHYNRPNIAI